MGKRGPAPAPTPIRILHGETKASRLNPNPPRPRRSPTGYPAMPDDLSDEAKRVWRRVRFAIGETGVVTLADVDILRAYCEAAARLRYASVQLEATGPMIRGARRGELVKNPLHQIVRDNAALVRNLGRELGLTPSSREALHAGGEDDADALTRWEAGVG